MLEKYKKRIKKYFYEILSEEKSEHSIALGFAIGTFICILPTYGFTILLCILIAFIFKKVNKLSLFGSLVVWNPITLFPIYYLSYKIGNLIYSSSPVVRYNVRIIDLIYNFSRRFLIGSVILAFAISIPSYFIIRVIFKKYKNLILKRLK